MASCRSSDPEACPQQQESLIHISEKPSDSQVWKQYRLQWQGCAVDIPGEYVDTPWLLEYENRWILACPIKRRTEPFLISRKDGRLVLEPMTENIDYRLLMDRCRRMRYDPVRLINGTWLQVRDGQLLSHYSVECFHQPNYEPGDAVYLEWTILLDIDWARRTLRVKKIVVPPTINAGESS